MEKKKEVQQERDRVLALVEGSPPVKEKKTAAERFVWPDLVYKEFLASIAVVLVLVIWGLVIDAPLRAEADASWTENPAKAPWYFLGLQELLVYFDPWLAGVIIPTLIVVGLAVIPYIDTNSRLSGEYNLSKRKTVTSVFLFGSFLWFALIIVGTFLRGPSWNFYWPWESWLVTKHVSETLVSFPFAAGLIFLGVYFVGGTLLPLVVARNIVQRLGIVRYLTVAFLLLSMLFVPIKIFLRVAFNIKYILVTPFFNI
jgi:hypothetical protein